MAYIVMAYTSMAYTVMACTVMALAVAHRCAELVLGAGLEPCERGLVPVVAVGPRLGSDRRELIPHNRLVQPRRRLPMER